MSSASKLFLTALAFGGGMLLLRKNDNSLPAMRGANYDVDDYAKEVWNGRNTGVEKIINDRLHYGVGENVYAYRKELDAAGIDYTPSKNSLFGYIKKKDIKPLLNYLLKTDGYLDIS